MRQDLVPPRLVMSTPNPRPCRPDSRSSRKRGSSALAAVDAAINETGAGQFHISGDRNFEFGWCRKNRCEERSAPGFLHQGVLLDAPGELVSPSQPAIVLLSNKRTRLPSAAHQGFGSSRAKILRMNLYRHQTLADRGRFSHSIFICAWLNKHQYAQLVANPKWTGNHQSLEPRSPSAPGRIRSPALRFRFRWQPVSALLLMQSVFGPFGVSWARQFMISRHGCASTARMSF